MAGKFLTDQPRHGTYAAVFNRVVAKLEDSAPRAGRSPAVIRKYLRERPQWGDDNAGVRIRRSGAET